MAARVESALVAGRVGATLWSPEGKVTAVIFNYLLTCFYVLVCVALLMVILLQQGKGGDIAAAFGGSSSQAAFGARAGATLLTRVTTVAAVLFILGSLGLSVMWQRGGGRSVISGVGTPAAPASAPAQPAPQQPASQQPAPQQPAPQK